MSLKLSFTGRIKSRKRIIKQIKEIAERDSYEVYTDQENGIIVTLCPIGDITFDITDGGFLQKGKVEGYFQSTPAGPGFHKAAVEFIDSLKIENLVYEDDTEYAVNRDFAKLSVNHFQRWLETIVEHVQQIDADGPIFVCWSTEQYKPDIQGAKIVTPVGVWNINNLYQFIQDKGVKAFADRFFIWPHEEQDAIFYRNCALKTLWEDCYYAPSDRSEKDAVNNKYIIENIERAYSLDPLLPLPYDSCCEICRLDCKKPTLPETTVRMVDECEPGYRRGLVKDTIDKITITIPGTYQRQFEYNDNGWPITIWSDSSSNSLVWRLTIFELDKEVEMPKSDDKEHLYNEEFNIENGKALLTVDQFQEDGKEYFMAVCNIASGMYYYLITVSYTKQEEFDQIRNLLLRMNLSPNYENS
jgi:hypothetical protein